MLFGFYVAFQHIWFWIDFNPISTCYGVEILLKKCWNAIHIVFGWKWVETLSKSTLISSKNNGDIVFNIKILFGDEFTSVFWSKWDQNQPEKLQISCTNRVEKLLKCYLVSMLNFNKVDLDKVPIWFQHDFFVQIPLINCWNVIWFLRKAMRFPLFFGSASIHMYHQIKFWF
jgi:hypothetical protein